MRKKRSILLTILSLMMLCFGFVEIQNIINNKNISVNSDEIINNEVPLSFNYTEDTSGEKAKGSNWTLTNDGTVIFDAGTISVDASLNGMAAEVKTIVIKDGKSIINSKALNSLVNATDLYVLGGEFSVGESGFDSSTLVNVYIDAKVTLLDKFCFYNATKLKELYIKELACPVRGYIYQGEDVTFKGTNSLENITIDKADGVVFQREAFSGAGAEEGLSLFVIGNNITFEESTFSYSKLNIVKVTGDNNKFGATSFYGSTIKCLKVYGKNTSFLQGAFCNATSLKNVSIDNLGYIAGLVYRGEKGPFQGASGIEYFEVKTCVNGASVGDNAFSGAGTSNATFIFNGNNLSFGGAAFSSSSFETFTANGTNLTIGENCFGSSNGKEIILNTTNTVIAAGAFNNSKLENLYVMELNHIKSLENQGQTGAFTGTASLKSVFFEKVLDNGFFGAKAFFNAGGTDGFDFYAFGKTFAFGDWCFGGANVNKFYVEADTVSLGVNCFNGSKVDSVYMTSINTAVNKGAFSNCSTLKTVFIKGLSLVGSIEFQGDVGAFQGDTALESFTVEHIKDGLSFGRNAFYSAGGGEGFDFIIKGDNVTLGQDAFAGTKMNNVQITGKNLTIIANCFRGSTVKDVKLYTTKTVISVGSFNNCASLKNIYIKELKSFNGIEFQGEVSTFGGCSSLENVYIASGSIDNNVDVCGYDSPASPIIGHEVFTGAGCTDGFNFYANLDNAIFIGEAFSGSKINKFEVSGVNLTINADAFRGSTIKTLYLDTTNTKLAKGAFGACTRLESIYIYEVASLDSIEFQGDIGVFQGDTSISKVTFANVVDGLSFGWNSFASTGSTDGFTFEINGNNITFGNDSFGGSKISSLHVSGENLIIGASAFNGSGLKTINLDTTNTIVQVSSFSNNTSLKEVYIKELNRIEDVVYQGEYGAFSSATSLETFYIGHVVDNGYIGLRAFSGSGTSQTNGFNFYFKGNNFTLNSESFSGSKMDNLKIEGQDITIGDNAFRSSTLKHININATNVSLGKGAFGGCSSLVDVYIKELATIGGVVYQGDIGTFENDIALEKVVFESVLDNAVFGYRAFKNAGTTNGIDFIAFGSNLSLGQEALAGAKINNLILEATTISIDSSAFSGMTGSTAKLSTNLSNYSTISTTLIDNGFSVSQENIIKSDYVDIPSVEDIVYESSDNYKNTILKAINNKNITSLTLRDDCIEIASNALAGCNSLTYNEYKNGYYLGTASNPYHALVKCNDSFELHPDCVIYYESAFAEISSCNVKVTGEEVFSALDFDFSNEVVLEIPSTWDHILAGKYDSYGVKDLDKSTNVKVLIPTENNITEFTSEELQYIFVKQPKILKLMKVKKAKSTPTVRILDYASGTDEIKIGDMFYAKLEGYTGKVFYLWSINDGAYAYHAYDSNDTYSNFMGTICTLGNETYYSAPYAVVMSGDNVPAGATISLKVVAFTDEGLDTIAVASATVGEVNLNDAIPDKIDLSITIGEMFNINDILTDRAIPHALRCVTIKDVSIVQGSEYATVDGTYVCTYGLGTVKITYSVNQIECYDHGHALTLTNKELYLTIIPEEKSLNVDNQLINATLNPTKYNYDGQEKVPTLTVVDKNDSNKELLLGTDYIITNNSITSAKEPGKYSITIKGINSYSGTRTFDWEITFGEIAIDDWTYGNNPSSPVISKVSRTDYTIKYQLIGSDEFSYEKPINAGDYICQAVFENMVGPDFVIETTFKVLKRDATITIVSKSSIYGNDIVTLEASTNNILDSDKDTAYTLSTLATKTADVGFYDITIVDSSNNYNFTLINQTNSYEIKVKEIEIIWDEDNYTYNKSVQEVHAKYKDIYNQDISLSVEIDDFKNAGDYTATAFFANSETNYVLPSVVTKNYTMKQKSIKDSSITSSLLIESIDYDGNEHVNSVTVNDGTDELTNTDFQTSGDISSIDAGKKKITITGIGNYKDSFEKEWRVIGITFEISVSMEDFEYDDSPSTPSLSENISGGKVTISYRKAGDTEYVTTIPTLVGNYEILYEIDGKGGYDYVSAESTFKIVPRKIAIPAADQTMYTYNGNEQTYSIPESKYYTVSNNKATKAGSYNVIVSLIDKDNTIWEDLSKTDKYHAFIINKANAVIKADNIEKYLGARDPELTYTVDGLFGSDRIRFILEREPGEQIGTYNINVSYIVPDDNYNVTSEPGKFTIKIRNNTDEVGKIEITVTKDNQPLDGAIAYLQYCDIQINYVICTNGSAEISNVPYGHYSLVVKYNSLTKTTPIDVLSPTIPVTADFSDNFVSTIVEGDVMISSDNITGIYSQSYINDIQKKYEYLVCFTELNTTSDVSKTFDLDSYFQNKNINATITDYINAVFMLIYQENVTLSVALTEHQLNDFQNITIPVTNNLYAAMEQEGIDLSYLHIYNNIDTEKFGVKEIPYTTEEIAKKAKGNCFYIRDVAGGQYIVLHVNELSQFCLALETSQNKIVKNIPKTNIKKSDDVDGNIFKCAYHWLILLFIVLYLAVEAGIFMIAPKNEIEAKDSDNEFVKWIKKLSIQNICHLVASLIWFIFFIIGCINAKCFICVVFLIIEFILLLAVVAYVFLPYTKVVVEKMNNWNEKRMEEKKKHPAKEKTYEEVSINKEDAFKDKVVKALKKAWIATQKAFDFAKKKTEQGFDYVMDKTTKGLEKATEVAAEAKEQVSLADATKLALAALPTFEISKKTIADYLEGKYKPEDVIVNRKPNVVANTKLPLADTHYAKIMENGKENKACFVYVYELETMFMDKQCTGMLLLIKLNKDLQKDYMKAHKSAKMSAFPIGGQWMAMPIDSSYDWKEVTKILDETYDYQLKEVQNKLAEKKVKAEAKAKAQ